MAMNVERKVGRSQVGGWEFLAATGELRRSTEVRRLEPRAAKALELLLDAGGEVVSQDELIAKVWGGRSLSDNSVAVVIGQLRKALDDDAREPKLIETIPKRGYRLREATVESEPRKRRRSVLLAVGAIVLTLLIALGFRSELVRPLPLGVAVSDVTNDTGNTAYDPLARATSELIVTELGQRGYAVRRSGGADLRLQSKLVMWDDMPFLGITATDGTGVVRWSLMANAMPGRIPPAVSVAFDDLAAKYPPKDGRERLAKAATAR